MMHTKRSPRDCPLPLSGRTKPYGGSGKPSANCLCIPHDLKGIRDPVKFLHIFSKHVWYGVLTVRRHPIQNRSMYQYLRSTGKILASVGTTDLRLNTVVIIYFRMGWHIVAYVRLYPPPYLVRNFQISIL